MTNKITQEIKEKLKIALKLHVNEHINQDEQINDQIEIFEAFTSLKSKQQQLFFDNFAKTSKISSNVLKKYFYRDFTKEFLYHLDEKDQNIIKQICADSRGKSQQQLLDCAINVFYTQQDKKVHIQSLRQAIRYYLKKLEQK